MRIFDAITRALFTHPYNATEQKYLFAVAHYGEKKDPGACKRLKARIRQRFLSEFGYNPHVKCKPRVRVKLYYFQKVGGFKQPVLAGAIKPPSGMRRLYFFRNRRAR